MIKLILKYSQKQEEESINGVKKDLNWIKKHNYKVILPKSLDINTLADQSSETITKVVEKEYNQTDYEQISKDILSQWTNKSDILQKKVSEMKRQLEDTYNIYLTKYGFVGSYELPNEIMVNISNRTTGQMVNTIIHEIFHLSIETLIIKYHLSHKQKEEVVNLITARAFPMLKKQTLLEEGALIEKIFEENFPNIEKIIAQISVIG
jgi:hypothetical protein